VRRATLLGVLALGCASTSPEPAFRDVAKDVHARLGQRIAWTEGGTEEKELERAADVILAREMRVEDAVQVALLRNKNLVAMYEELGIAQADLVQAGLLRNPSFSIGASAAERDNLQPNLVLGVTESFLDVFMIPARTKIAETELEETKKRVGDAVLGLAGDVRAAYFTLQGAQQIALMRKVVADAADASAEIAGRQTEAGNLSDLALASEQAQREQARLDLARAEGDVMRARETLTRLMGVFGTRTQWRIAPRLPELPADEPPLDHLEMRAIDQRLDLAALRQEVQTLTYALRLVEQGRFVGALAIGADVARLKSSGQIAVGPRAEIELPLFDQRQAAIARLEALLRLSEARLHARAVEARSEVRSARDRVVLTRRVAKHAKEVMIPLRERVVRLSQEQYDAMLLGVYQLLAAKQAEVTAYREYIEAIRDYWLARSDLERAVGGRLTDREKKP
jgi:cobalt-zinc-cadmium efflux system outer membrane protein